MTGAIVGILLAAGAARRFGSDKLIFPLAGGRSMALVAASNLRPACDRLVVVLRSADHPLAALLDAEGAELVIAADADGGMGHSLAAAVRATPEAAGWVVALADMPFIRSASHAAVAAALRAGASLAATEFQGRRGHPVGFSRQWLAPLSALAGDQGGRDILREHRQQLVSCAVDDAGVLTDIDRPDDLPSFAPGRPS